MARSLERDTGSDAVAQKSRVGRNACFKSDRCEPNQLLRQRWPCDDNLYFNEAASILSELAAARLAELFLVTAERCRFFVH